MPAAPLMLLLVQLHIPFDNFLNKNLEVYD